MIYLLGFLGTAAAASYVNNVTYAGSDFFSGFQFETFDDPTHGYVDFVNQSVAESNGLISTNSQNQVYIGYCIILVI